MQVASFKLGYPPINFMFMVEMFQVGYFVFIMKSILSKDLNIG